MAQSIEKAITRKSRGTPHVKYKDPESFFDCVGFFPTEFFCYWGESHLDKKFASSDNVNLMFTARRQCIPDCIKLRRGIPLPAVGVALTQRNDMVKKLVYWSPNREGTMNWGSTKQDEDSSLMNQGNIMFYAKEGYKHERALQEVGEFALHERVMVQEVVGGGLHCPSGHCRRYIVRAGTAGSRGLALHEQALHLQEVGGLQARAGAAGGTGGHCRRRALQEVGARAGTAGGRGLALHERVLMQEVVGGLHCTGGHCRR